MYVGSVFVPIWSVIQWWACPFTNHCVQTLSPPTFRCSQPPLLDVIHLWKIHSYSCINFIGATKWRSIVGSIAQVTIGENTEQVFNFQHLAVLCSTLQHALEKASLATCISYELYIGRATARLALPYPPSLNLQPESSQLVG